MNMATLIFACEYGTGLGTASAFMPVANALREADWTVEFALPHAAPGIELVKRTLAMNKYNYFDAPGACVGAAMTHAEIIASGSSFVSAAVFDRDLDFWLRQIATLKADIVVASRAVLPLIAARISGVRRAAVDSGFLYWSQDEPVDISSDHGALQSPQRLVESHVLDIVNSSLCRRGKPVLKRFGDLFDVDRMIYLNSPELVPATRNDRQKFIGIPPAGERGMKPKWPIGGLDRPKIFVYLKLRLANAIAILNVLRCDTSLSVIACVPDATADTVRKFASPHLTLIDDVLDMTAVLDEADAVVCNGGTVLVSQALAAGKPLLLAPALAEQQFNAVAVARLKAAVLLPLNSPEDLVRVRLNQLLENTFARGLSFTACARAFMRRNGVADVEAIAAQIAHLFKPKPTSARPRHVSTPHYRSQRFAEYDVIFLSFDEPDADANWRTLSERVGKAVRVHGVTGFDASHKAAAAASTTERFILVDADNVMDERFFSVETPVPALFDDATWQWCSVNNVTGLAYPFGGPKVWTRTQVNAMRSHEACEDRGAPMATDFWAQPGYYTFQRIFSANVTNGSPYQSFRSAFREGAKLAGWNGLVRTPADFKKISKMPQSRRLAIWMSVGADIQNGWWSLLGARMGFLSYFDPHFEHAKVGEYGWFESYWDTIFADIAGTRERGRSRNGKKLYVFENEVLKNAVVKAGDAVRSLAGEHVAVDMTAAQSIQFKRAMHLRRSVEPEIFKPFGLMDGF
jgi:Glycosyltransferase family 28 C-terminal domain